MYTDICKARQSLIFLVLLISFPSLTKDRIQEKEMAWKQLAKENPASPQEAALSRGQRLQKLMALTENKANVEAKWANSGAGTGLDCRRAGRADMCCSTEKTEARALDGICPINASHFCPGENEN